MATTVQNNGMSAEVMAAMNAPKKSAAADGAAAAQDRFMTLLVTQMKHQDPLNPLDNAQMTSQLAQLSTVTGIDKLNTTLQALQGSYQASQTLQAVSMIGHGVLVPGTSVDLVEGKAVLGVELTESVDSMQIDILDASGKLVRRMDFGGMQAGVVPLTWDGTADGGSKAADGSYTFEVTANRGGQKVSVNSLAFGGVGSVATGANGVKVSVPGMGEFGLGDIRQIL